jgi:hypothetical protein
MTKTIKAPAGAVYLDEFMDSLPFGIINKKSTGCGGTTVALECAKDYIVCVPTVNLITNKCAQYPRAATPERKGCDYELLGVHGGVTNNEIKDYLETHKVHKIITTYDSLPRLAEMLELSDYHVLVDEYQNLLSAYAYRSEAINALLDILENHPKVSYISATPTGYTFTPSQLQKLDYYVVEWPNTQKVKVERVKVSGKPGAPLQAAVNIIKSYLKGQTPTIKNCGEVKKSSAAYFFLSSVRGIKAIIDKAQLKPEQVRIICADTARNRSVLENLPIAKASEMTAEDEKPFNFITRASFEGCDFFSNSGICYIVTDCKNKATMYDVAVDIQQIAGRIRTASNPFKHQIVHIYNSSLCELTPEEFEQVIEERKQRATETIENYETVKHKAAYLKNTEALVSKDTDAELFVRVKDEAILYDELKEKLTRYTYEVVRSIYTDGVSIREAYLKAGYDVTSPQQYYDLVDFMANIKGSNDYVELMKEYVELKARKCDIANFYRLEEILQRFPDIREAYDELGAAKIKALSFQASKINRELIVKRNYDIIKQELKHKLEVGKPYSKQEVKEQMQNIYDTLGLIKTAKATDLTDYADVKRIKHKGDSHALIIWEF